MNKMLKLPLFLGVVGGLCGGVLAGTNYITKGPIQKGEEARLNAAYIKHFADFANKTTPEVTEALQAAGVTSKVLVYNSSNDYIGSIYQCTVTGFASDITFTVSFRDGQICKYVNIAASETGNGPTTIANLNAASSSELANILANGKPWSGGTYTFEGINPALQACSADYLAEYQNIPDFTA
jgi:hypothetical protein